MIDFLLKVLLPFLAGALLQSYRTQFSETIAQINELIEEIQDARDAATKYWSRAESEVEPSLASEVRSAVHLILALAPEIRMADRRGLDDALDEFGNQCTGGLFETKDRPADLARALDARLAAADLISLLRRRRGEINSWAFLVVEAWRGVRTWGRAVFRPYELGRLTKRALRRLGISKGNDGT